MLDLPVSLDTPDPDPLHAWLGQVVVCDTQGPLIYIGTLAAASDRLLTLTQADVHDSNDSPSTKDLYLLDTRTLGLKVNRARVLVERRAIVSISLLADIQD